MNFGPHIFVLQDQIYALATAGPNHLRQVLEIRLNLSGAWGLTPRKLF